MVKSTTFVRSLSALVLMPIVLYIIWVGGYAYIGLITLLSGLATFEWVRMVHGHSWVWRLGGMFTLLLSFISLLWLRSSPGGLDYVLFLFIITWVTDTGAYFGGRFFGGPKLAPRISPNKTISGALSGLALAFLVGAFFPLTHSVHVRDLSDSPSFYMVAALIVGAIVISGDLLESACKRYFGIKDSGGLIPGHGGILDRLDGLLLAAPLLALAHFMLIP